MASELYMPQMGLTMKEGKVIRWLKAPGDAVRKGEPVVEIETDKVRVEVESPADGVLGPIVAGDGTVLTIGQTMGYVLAAGESAPTAPKGAPAPGPQPAIAAAPGEEKPARAAGGAVPHVSPLARRLAEELGVDLSKVEATGPSGRIVADDVRRAAQQPVASTPAAAAPVGQPTPSVAAAVPTGKAEPLQGVRRVVAERMTHSFTTAPHFYLTVEVEATALTRMRDGLLARVEAANGAHLTITDILIKAVAQALSQFPEVNVAWSEGDKGILRQAGVNLGVAVALDDGLIVPVIHAADTLSLAEIARRRTELTQKAREGKLTLHEVEGGTFTLTNLGMYGIDQFQAIINPTQGAILAVGRIKERPVAVSGSVAVRPTVFLSLSADHRQLDGAQAARFLQHVAQVIEEPYLLVS